MNIFDKNSEASFLINGVFKFIKVWQSGNKSTLILHSKNKKGKTWGGPHDQQKKFAPKPKSKSKRKQDKRSL